MSVMLVVGGAMPAAAQRSQVRRNVGPTRLGVFVGSTFGSMVGAGVIPVKSRTGIEGGAFVIAPFTENFALRTGISYVQKGVTDSLSVSYGAFAMSYVEIPVLFRITALPGDDFQMHVLAGVSFGFKSACTFRVDSLTTPQTTVYDGACGGSRRNGAFDINRTDNSVMAGLSLTLAPTSSLSYELTGLWQRSLQLVDPQVKPFVAKNQVFSVALGITYIVGGK
jgi:hypothetical protein